MEWVCGSENNLEIQGTQVTKKHVESDSTLKCTAACLPDFNQDALVRHALIDLCVITDRAFLHSSPLSWLRSISALLNAEEGAVGRFIRANWREMRGL